MKSRKYTSVFIGSLIISLILVALGFVPGYGEIAENWRSLIGTDFGWFYLLLVTLIVFVCGFFVLSPMGQIKLGEPDSKPEYSTGSWIAMLFSAGMGIGLVFYGSAEPLSHFASKTPHAEPGSQQAMADSFQFTFFHWGIHAWAVYGIVAMALAYFGFRKEEKYLLSVTLKPLFGKKTDGWFGYIIDIITVVATVIGVATTLGFGAIQINGGLSYLTHNAIPNEMWVQVIIIVVTTGLFVLSALSGLGKGIKILSNVNMVLAIALLAIAIVVGPTVKIFDNMTESIGLYLHEFFGMSFRTAAFNSGERSWIDTWTIFYWAWWISWSPFVGMFVARISRGRSIREFVVGVMIIPAAVTVVWFSIFGGTAIHFEQENRSVWGEGDAKRQLFDLLYSLPGGTIAAIVAMILLATFFITSADSAATVMGSMSQQGVLVANKWVTAAWGVLTAAIGLTLLVSGGNDALSNLQNVTIIAASPFLVVIIGLMVSLYRGLSDDPLYLDHKEQQKFAMRLARERRVHSEMRAELQAEQRRRARKAARVNRRPIRFRAPKTD